MPKKARKKAPSKRFRPQKRRYEHLKAAAGNGSYINQDNNTGEHDRMDKVLHDHNYCSNSEQTQNSCGSIQSLPGEEKAISDLDHSNSMELDTPTLLPMEVEEDNSLMASPHRSLSSSSELETNTADETKESNPGEGNAVSSGLSSSGEDLRQLEASASLELQTHSSGEIFLSFVEELRETGGTVSEVENESGAHISKSVADTTPASSVVHPPRLAPAPKPPKDLLVDVHSVVSRHSRVNWVFIVNDVGLQSGLMAKQNSFVIQRSLFVSPMGDVSVQVHGRQLLACHQIHARMAQLPKIILTDESVESFADNFLKLLDILRSYEICRGVEKFQDMWMNCNGAFVDYNPFQEFRYSKTLRANDCLLLVESLRFERCLNCKTLYLRVSEKKKRKDKHPTCTPPDKKAVKDLNTPERKKRFKKVFRKKRNLQLKYDRLRVKLSNLINKEGVDIDPELSEDLTAALTDEKFTKTLTPFQKLFIEQQIKAAKVKRPCGMRWHPAMIRFALQLKSASSAAYEALSGLLRLPSERVLFDYSHAIAPKEGCHYDIMDALSDEVEEKRSPGKTDMHALSWDEIFTKKNLVHRKSDGKIIGYVNLNDAEKELDAIGRLVSDKITNTTNSSPARPPIATKALVYMVKGLSNGVRRVVATYSEHSTSKEQLFQRTWEVGGELEIRNIGIGCFVCDGASINRAFFDMHTPITRTESGVIFDTVNLAATDRVIYFLSDPPHLLKTCRNCLHSSGRKGQKSGNIRNLRRNGEEMLWSHIVELYRSQSDNTLRLAFKLNASDVFLTPRSIMKVSNAAHVMSRSVAELFRRKGQVQMALLLENVNDMIDMMNGAHTRHGDRTRNRLLDPYRSEDDPRFDKLMDILKFFQDWEKEVEVLPGLSREAKNKCVFSKPTMKGLELTIRGFVGTVKMSLRYGESYVNAINLSQDDLEHYFSRQRCSLGGNRNPDMQQVLQNQVNFFAQSKFAFHARKRGSSAPGRRKPPTLEELEKPVAKRRKARRSLPF